MARRKRRAVADSQSDAAVSFFDGRLTLVGDAARTLVRNPKLAAMFEDVERIIRAAKPEEGPHGFAIVAHPKGIPVWWEAAQVLAALKRARRGEPIQWDFEDLITGKRAVVDAPMSSDLPIRPSGSGRPRGAPRTALTSEQWDQYWKSCTPAEQRLSPARHADRLRRRGLKASATTIRRRMGRLR